ncbi:MAG: hypothetical protein WBA76_15035 [Phormidesmis sp.]
MFDSYDSVWSNLLFKIVSVPFVLLLVVVAAHQTISLHNSADSKQSPGNLPEQSETSSPPVDGTLF